MNTRFIFVTGGVASALGKGLSSASLGALLKARGFSVKIRKLDPYLNIDPGTMSPIQHGEVFVTDDGAETDLDLGHYERYTGVSTHKSDSITSGQIYQTILTKERRGDYLGATVQVVPHVINEIKNFFTQNTEGIDFLIYEIGGTVGDIEGLPFIEAVRQFRNDVGRDHTLCIHLTFLPYIKSAGELKTKPTQHSVKELLSQGIQPDILLCRCEQDIPREALDKIALFCNVDKLNVIPAIDINDVYELPISLHEEGLDSRVCAYFKLQCKEPDLEKWLNITQKFHPIHIVKVGIVGKYFQLADAYKSLIEALKHAGFATMSKVEIIYFDAENLNIEELKNVDAIIVPGGYGDRGVKGKLMAINYARINNVPFLGICLGLQLATIEFVQNVLGIKTATSTEFDVNTPEPVVFLLEEWQTQQGIEKRSKDSELGGTMRLGSYPCQLSPDSLAYKIYGEKLINERHRHRYEINMAEYGERLAANGFVFSGLSPDGKLPEIGENKNNKFFIGVQYHPELKSRPFDPHPLFVGLVKAAIK